MPTPVPRADPPQLEDPEATARRIQQFIETTVSAAEANGVVVNLSGGIDSTVAATLATRALGSDRVTGLILPTEANRSANTDDAIQLAEELVIDHRVIDIQELLDTFVKTVSSVTRQAPSEPWTNNGATMTIPVKQREDFTAAVGNAAARLRMMIAYFEANTTNALVLGTGNRTELLVGYFTKYGDGGVDCLPIGNLYKSEVRQLARTLDVRESIRTKESTAGLWAGQADEEELGVSYERLDTMLWNLVEADEPPEAIAERLDIELERVHHCETMLASSQHKRRMPRTPDTDGIDPPRT